MPLFTASVLANEEIARDYFRMDFSWPHDVRSPAPGEFVTVRVADTSAPLLRRPFGVSAFSEGRCSMIYWRRGPGTRLLAGYEPGDALNVMAPLGHGFPAPAGDAVPVLAAGGVGIGPLLFFANALAAEGRSPVLLVGARTGAGQPRVQVDPAVQIRRATDDGTHGFHGTVIELLERTIATTSGGAELYLCGPNPMLRAGHDVAGRLGLPAWVSMEQTMGCAVGACMGCAVRVHGPERYARVCTEGPVFRSTEIVWE
ncbi:MAG: dihydroorotate dehydrogenase electron transfer subunit [Spirochaetota bacterium]